MHPDDVERMKGYHMARRQGDKDAPSQYEFRFIDKAGNVRDSFLTIGMIPGTRQSIVSIMDITQIKQMQRELEQTRKMAILGEMSAHVAHEVRNPLQKIKTGVELLSNSLSVDERQRRQLDGVKHGVDNLEKFVTQILEWTRSGELRPRPHRISNIIDGLLFNIEDAFSLKEVKVQTFYDPDADIVVVDGIQLRQAFGNIIDNALDAMPHGGSLKSPQPSFPGTPLRQGKRLLSLMPLRYALKIPAAALPRKTWNVYSSLSLQRRLREPGLGLALVKKVIDMHHGEVEALSAKGKGSEFIIRIPCEKGGSLRESGSRTAGDHRKH